MKKPRIRTVIGTIALVALIGGGMVGLRANAQWQADRDAAVAAAASFGEDPAVLADAIDQTGVVIREDVEALRVAAEAKAAAEAEAARVAAEAQAAADAAAAQAAAAEAARQAAAVKKPSSGGGSAAPGKMRVPLGTNPDGSTYPDTTQCPSGSASTGADGVNYCD
jgi:membrane protein involved in colicin uptake